MDTASQQGTVLITGVTGFVGLEVLVRYLERTDREVCVLVRAPDRTAAAERVRESLATVVCDPDAAARRVTALPADIESDGLGLAPQERERLAAEVTDIVHSAASVSFSLPLPESRSVNVEGTRRLLELADLCRSRGGLRRFAYVSTAYVAGTHEGEFREDQLDIGQGFRNPYERSKFEAERLVHEAREHLPVQVLRPSIVVGEHRSGWTSSFNVLYSPLKAFARGALRALPARRSAPVDVVPVDYVADAVFELATGPAEDNGTFHLVAGPAAPSVGRLIELAADQLGRRRPLTLPPALYRRVVHPLLLRRNSGRRRRALERMEVFFPYFAIRTAYANERTRRRLEPAGVSAPPLEGYFHRLVGFAQAARWGRRPIRRPDAG